MKNFGRKNYSLFFTVLIAAYVPMTQADGMQSYGSYRQQAFHNAQLQHFTDASNPSYGSEISAKALNGVSNLLTGPLEIPKNIINTTNQSNVFYGIFGGLFKGIVHTAGRLAVGLADLATFTLLTKPIAQPLYVWNDFYRDTTYGDVFSLQETQEVEPPVAQTPPPPVAPTEKPAPVEYPSPYSPETNKKLDMIFKKEMMK